VNINSDWENLKNKLACHHSIFYKIVEMGKPYFTDKIPTAAVQFNKEGKFINFLFNKNFWEQCSDYKKMFVVCHEALHIILQHGTRFLENVNNQISNIAMDVVVNHSLVRDFGFIRSEVDSKTEYCWVDTVFKDKKYLGLPYPDDESSEFYYNEIEKIENENSDGNNGQSGGKAGNKLVDDHSGISDEELEELVKKEIESLNPEEKGQLQKSLNNIKKAGSLTGNWFNIEEIKESRKKKWETVIKKWEIQALKFVESEREQWIRRSRRMNSFDNGLILPSTAETECFSMQDNKINVHFFLDTSGSCINLASRFFTAANSLPKEKFNIRMFCFDTKVVEVDIKQGKVYGGGGTRFDIIEEEIIKEKTKTNKYPAAVFIITDGYGNKVQPKFPKRWHWFLSENYKKYIPAESFAYDLKDFE
jgi:predicted metal-dependent peptidase